MLSDAEVKDFHVLYDELHSLSWVNSSICWQQSRLNWLREGGANSKFFHNIMSSRRRRNDISSILVDGVPVEELPLVRGAFFFLSHFAARFKAILEDRPGVENLGFHTLSHGDSVELIKCFFIIIRGQRSGLGL